MKGLARFMGKTRESTTMQLLLLPFGLVNWKYYQSETMSATEFATAIAALLAVWLTREWRSAHYQQNTNADSK